MSKRTAIPRASIQVGIINDEDFICLTTEYGYHDFGVFAALIVLARDMEMNPIPMSSVRRRLGLGDDEILGAVGNIEKCCKANGNKPWLSVADGSVKIRSFSVWNQKETRGGKREGAGRKKSKTGTQAEKRKAINAVNSAIRRGEIPPVSDFDCVSCGDVSENYHHDDYKKPFQVTPLCVKCHGAIHSADNFDVSKKIKDKFFDFQKQVNKNSKHSASVSVTVPVTDTGTEEKKDSAPPASRKRLKRNLPSEYGESFQRFWESFPANGGSKKEAWWSWWRQDLDELAEGIIAAVDHSKSTIWKDSEPGHIPHAVTWLNQERWETAMDISCSREGQTTEQYIQEVEDFARRMSGRVA